MKKVKITIYTIKDIREYLKEYNMRLYPELTDSMLNFIYETTALCGKSNIASDDFASLIASQCLRIIRYDDYREDVVPCYYVKINSKDVNAFVCGSSNLPEFIIKYEDLEYENT